MPTSSSKATLTRGEPLMGWPLNALMVRLLVIIGPDLFSAMEEWKWKRAQQLAPKGVTT